MLVAIGAITTVIAVTMICVAIGGYLAGIYAPKGLDSVFPVIISMVIGGAIGLALSINMLWIML